jgi:hypothetical protein
MVRIKTRRETGWALLSLQSRLKAVDNADGLARKSPHYLYLDAKQDHAHEINP